MIFLGIDIGTQSLKAMLTDAALRPLGSGSVAYQPSYPQPGWAEQDPAIWLAALQPAIAGALAEARLQPDDVTAMAICGQLDGCIATAADGRALGPAIIWMDRRALASIAGIDPMLVRDRAGVVLDAIHMAAKIRWRREHLDTPDAVAVWHQPVSFLVEALTGARVMDHCLASTTMLYGLASKGWDDALLEAFAIDPATLPAIAEASSVAGRLNARGAALTGLKTGLPLAVGTGDDFSNPIGCGICAAGTVGVTLGTGEALGALATTPIIDPGMLVETHAFPGGNFYLSNPGWMSGGAVRWFQSVFSVASAAEFSELAAAAPPGSDGLLFIPALSGAMAPRWVPEARGTFYGMSAAHTKAHFARAVLEGTSFAMRDVVDRLDALGVETGTIRAVGGGAASPVWMQIRADLTGRPVDAMTEGDASALGAAVLASVAGGAFAETRAASQALDLPLRRIEPVAARYAVYDDAYWRYRKLFDALEPLY